MNRKLPLAPPPRNRTPVKQRSFPELSPNSTVSGGQHEGADNGRGQPKTGAVNRMKGLFEQKQETGPPQRRTVPEQQKTNRYPPPATVTPKPHLPLMPPLGGAAAEKTPSSKPRIPPQPPTRDKPVNSRTQLPHAGEKREDKLSGHPFSSRQKGVDGKLLATASEKRELEEKKSLPTEAEQKFSPKRLPFPRRGQSFRRSEETSSDKKVEEASKKHKVPFSVLRPGREGSPPPAPVEKRPFVKSAPSTTPLLPIHNSDDKARRKPPANGCHAPVVSNSEYEPVEFRPLSSMPSSAHSSTTSPSSSSSASSSSKPSSFLLPSTKPLSNAHPSSLPASQKQKAKLPPASQNIPTTESKPLPLVPSQPKAPQRRQYENIYIKQAHPQTHGN